MSTRSTQGVAGLRRMVSVRPPFHEDTPPDQDDWFDIEDLEIWALLPDAVSLVDSSLEELSIGVPGREGGE